MYNAYSLNKVNWIGNVYSMNCLLIHLIEIKIYGKIEGKRMRGTRHSQLLDDFKEKRR